MMGTTRTPSATRTVEALDGAVTGTARRDLHDPRYQAFALMRLAFCVAPIAFGLDKFFNILVDWSTYLAPWINDAAPAR